MEKSIIIILSQYRAIFVCYHSKIFLNHYGRQKSSCLGRFRPTRCVMHQFDVRFQDTCFSLQTTENLSKKDDEAAQVKKLVVA
jgi:hypothetical protein